MIPIKYSTAQKRLNGAGSAVFYVAASHDFMSRCSMQV
jgi:hypothetical protein